ncbi:hypothetical protein CFSAN001081_02447 [Salmonella enterica subsp. enterica serovar London str. CFSAN001081]|nr:hypothetical protein CFSAN001081_02447 [Salmonella enterica subsp. enterica serovar London str. CFSAN001081]
MFNIPWQRRHILLISDLSATKISTQGAQLLRNRTTRPEKRRFLVAWYALHRVKTLLRLFRAISARIFVNHLLINRFRFCRITFVLHDNANFVHRVRSLRRLRIVFYYRGEIIGGIIFFTLVVIQLAQPIIGVRLISRIRVFLDEVLKRHNRIILARLSLHQRNCRIVIGIRIATLYRRP